MRPSGYRRTWKFWSAPLPLLEYSGTADHVITTRDASASTRTPSVDCDGSRSV
jgi:hypothetical protein